MRPARRIGVLLAALVVLAASPRATAEPRETPMEHQELRLAVGEQTVLSAQGVESYSEGTRGICDVRLTRDATQFVLVGKVAGETTLLFLMQNGSEQHFDIVVFDPNAVEAPKGDVVRRENIRLDFYFVELDKTYSHQLGIGWPASVGGRAAASFDLVHQRFTSASAVVTNQALPRLDMAQASGWARVLRQAAVVTANGSRATFSGGGEVNIPVSGSLAAEIRSIGFGSKVTVSPRYDASTGRIEVGLESSVADLTDDNGTGAPGRMTSELQTLVNIELGQAIVLAGLSAHRETHTRTGLPGLSAIPILGALFGTHGAAEQQTESIVIIVPTVVEAVSWEDSARIQEALMAFDEYDGDIGGISEVWGASRKVGDD
jgi:pilus assembly protein CpaC